MSRKSHPLYSTWKNMRQRCNNANSIEYPDYGGRGILICQEWDDFFTFVKDLGDRPDGTSMDRIDNNKGYYKDNVRWATDTQQANNRRPRPNKSTGYPGVTKGSDCNKWIARVTNSEGKRVSLGYYYTIEEAALAIERFKNEQTKCNTVTS